MPIEIDESRLKDPEYREWLKSWNIQLPDEEPEVEEDPTHQPKQVAPEPESGPKIMEESTTPQSKRVDTNYENWTVEELQEKAGELEISKAGNKQQLIDRIRKTEA